MKRAPFKGLFSGKALGNSRLWQAVNSKTFSSLSAQIND
jgi:hypothetical protein